MKFIASFLAERCLILERIIRSNTRGSAVMQIAKAIGEVKFFALSLHKIKKGKRFDFQKAAKQSSWNFVIKIKVKSQVCSRELRS